MQPVEAYIECHYFASGFKSKFYGSDIRPNFLPEADSVGLHNEALLKGKDYAVEFTRREVNGLKLTWLGVYRSAKDYDYGDRGNYCGVGAWLVSSTPVHISVLLKGLLNLCEILAGNGLSNDFESDVSIFTNDYLNGYLIPDQWVPAHTPGISYFKDRYDSSKYKLLPANDDTSLALVANSIRVHCISKHDQEHNRAVYFVGNTSKITVPAIFELSLYEDIEKTEATLKSMLYENSGRVAEDNKLLSDNKILNELNAKLTSDINSLADKLSSLKQEYENSKKIIEDMKRENSQKSFFPSPQGEPNRTSSTNDIQLTRIQTALQNIQISIGRLEQNGSQQYQSDERNVAVGGFGGATSTRSKLFFVIILILTLLTGVAIGRYQFPDNSISVPSSKSL